MSQAADAQPCPRCGSRVHRVHRQPLDRLISIVLPRQRYRCAQCGWTGVRRASGRSNEGHAVGLRRKQVVLIVVLLTLMLVAGVAMTRIVFDQSTPSNGRPRRRSGQVMPQINMLYVAAGDLRLDWSDS
ncbi:MAG TPA: hypothetical protein VFF70_00460 [Anaerolineae bacterium]|nr:hypothetical protein [Anaerolineae bacterium]